jgi:transcriptional regulator with XRE-family HTH domain
MKLTIDPAQTGKRIKEARSALKLTQEGLARKIGVTKGAVSQWEKGYTDKGTPIEFKADNILRLAHVLSQNPYTLMYGQDINPTNSSNKECNDDKSQLDLPAAAFAFQAFREYVGYTEREALGVERELRLFDLLYRYYILSLPEGEKVEPKSNEVAKLLKLSR